MSNEHMYIPTHATHKTHFFQLNCQYTQRLRRQWIQNYDEFQACILQNSIATSKGTIRITENKFITVSDFHRLNIVLKLV